MACRHEKTASKLVRLESPKQPVKPTETVYMKCSKAAILRKTHRIPEIRFEDQRLTSFAGLVLYQSPVLPHRPEAATEPNHCVLCAFTSLR